MSHDPQLLRQWSLLKILSARHYGATIEEMAQETGVDPRTIRRYLKMFQNVGFPLEATKRAHGCKVWTLKAGASGTPDISFTFEEAIALWLGRRFLEPLAGTPLWQAAQKAFKKVRACLSNTALAYLDKMAERLHQTGLPGDYSDKAELIDRLMVAIEDAHVTFVNYQSLSATEPVQYELEPLGMVYHRGSIYLVATSREHRALRHFKIDRISDVAVENFKFERPADFDLSTHLAGSFGVFQGNDDVHVRVRFRPPVVRYVQEKKWHASEKHAPQTDGTLIAEYRLTSVEEIKRWLLSFGRHAEVLEPESLRSEMQEEGRVLASLYEGPTGEDAKKARENGKGAGKLARKAK